MSLDRWSRHVASHGLVGLLVFLISFFVYLKTLCPTIYVGDSGELICAASCLGIPHPPGYPFFVLLLKLFMLVIPFGSLAFRSAVASAIFGSAAVFFLFKVCLLLITGSRPGLPVRRGNGAVASATAAALLFSLSLTFWSQTTIAEVYALTMLVIALLLWLVLLWDSKLPDKADDRLLLAAAFVAGLGLSAHHTVALITPALAGYVVLRRPKIVARPGIVFGAATLWLFGASVYFMLPIRASVRPLLNWGQPDTLSSFIAHVLRREYGSPSTTPRTLALFGRQLGFYISKLARQFTWVGLAVLLVGLAGSFRRRRNALVLLVAVFLLCSLFFVLYTNFRLIPRDTYLVEVFFIPSFAIAAVFAAWGLDAILGWLRKLLRRRSLWLAACSAIVVALTTLPLLANYYYDDKSRNFITYDYGINMLKSAMADDAVFFVDRDMEVFTLLFLKDVERICPAIEIVDRSGILRRDFYPRQMPLLPEKFREAARLSAEHRFLKRTSRTAFYVPGVDLVWMREFVARPVGLGARVVPSDKARDYSPEELSVWKAFETRGLRDSSFFKDYTTRCVMMVWQQQLGDSFYWQGRRDEAMRLWRSASRIAGDIMIMHTMLAEKSVKLGETDLAIEEYNKIARLRPTDHLVFFNIATLLRRQGKLQAAARSLNRCLAIRPDFLEGLKMLANIYVELKDYAGAAKVAERIAHLSPNDPEAHRNLGVVFQLAGRDKDAMRAYRRATELDPTFAKAYADLAMLYEKLGEITKEKEALRRALALEPSLLKSDERLAKSTIAQQVQAELSLGEAPALSAPSPDQLRERIRKALARRDFNAALLASKRLVQLEPRNVNALIQLGIVLDQMGRSKEAENTLLNAVRLDPSSAEAHNALGVCYARRKEYGRAREEWETALKLRPNSPGIISNLRQLEALGY